jgi:predicted nucleotidyltransferase
MRKSSLLTALFPEVRQRILAATLLRPEKSWFLTELATSLGLQPSSLQREVDSLSEAGVLRQWRDGRRLYFAADRACPIFADLARLFEKTAGLVPLLQQDFEPFSDRIELAFVYGSVAQETEQSESDIDLLVVGHIGLADLIPTLRSAEARLGRPVNPTIYSSEEFHRKVRNRDHFLTSVLQTKKLFIKGGDDELAAVA